jgi:hypothetical protein
MERHGRAAWRDIDQKLGQGVSCSKLKSYWHFYGCRYEKVEGAQSQLFIGAPYALEVLLGTTLSNGMGVCFDLQQRTLSIVFSVAP